jgi:hypothetical protein
LFQNIEIEFRLHINKYNNLMGKINWL